MGDDDFWNGYGGGFYDYYDDNSIVVRLIDPGGGIGIHPAIVIDGHVFLFTSKQRHRGSSGYIEVYSGDGGLDLDSFLNVKDWHRYDDCHVYRELGYLSRATLEEIVSEVKRLHPHIDCDNCWY